MRTAFGTINQTKRDIRSQTDVLIKIGGRKTTISQSPPQKILENHIESKQIGIAILETRIRVEKSQLFTRSAPPHKRQDEQIHTKRMKQRIYFWNSNMRWQSVKTRRDNRHHTNCNIQEPREKTNKNRNEFSTRKSESILDSKRDSRSHTNFTKKKKKRKTDFLNANQNRKAVIYWRDSHSQNKFNL